MKDKTSFFTSRSLFSGITISFIFGLCGSSFWISGIVGTLLGVILLLLVKKVNNSKIVKFITGFIFATLALIVLVNMGHTMYLRDTPLFFLTIFPVICVLIMSNSKSESLIKVANIFFIYSVFLFFLKILGLYSHIELDNLHPLIPINYKNILWGSIVYMLVGVVPILALNDISDKKNTVLSYLAASITVLTVSFLAISVLGLKEVQLYRYPEYVMLKRIEFLNFVNNVDNFFNFAIITDLLFTIAFGFKNMESSSKYAKYSGVILVTILTLWLCMRSSVLLYVYEYLPFIFIFLLILLLIPKK